jgi:hypothetical protein
VLRSRALYSDILVTPSLITLVFYTFSIRYIYTEAIIIADYTTNHHEQSHMEQACVLPSVRHA